MSDEETQKGSNEVIATVGSFTASGATIAVTVAAYTDERGTRYPPTVRLTRASGKAGKARAMSSLKNTEEIEGVLKLLPDAAKALTKALAERA